MKRALLAVLFALAASAPAGAALHHWRLSGVAFDDGATARGSFTYDDATATVVSWHVSVDGGPNYLEFTYMPGVSTFFFQTEGAATTIVFSSVEAGLVHENGVQERQLRFTPTLPLSGASPVNPLDVVNYNNHSGGLECFNCGAGRIIVAGSLVPGPPADVTQAEAIEFYHAGLDHYFITADGGEATVLDTGGLPGWTRTGERFRVFHRDSPNDAPFRPVCRFYGLPSAGIASHFYSADPAECLRVRLLFPLAWQPEAGNVFQVALPDPTTGACLAGLAPVYRVYNNRADANHRYTTSVLIRAQMEAAGWVREGYGPDAVILCALPPA